MSIKKKKKAEESVEIPVTPMLDMAFQLLTFFILTYHPMPSEVQFGMHLMPAAPALKMGETAPADAVPDNSLPAMLKTLPTVLHAGEGGKLGRVTLNEVEVQGLPALKRELISIKSDPNLAFEQALIKIDGNLKYSELIQVIDVFHELKMNKISFGELTAGDEGG